ncbi:hypothetical protein GCM10023083_50880 [Streptomyces phyllanthi]
MFHTAGMTGARNTVYIVAGSVWPVPIALAATVVGGPGETGPVRRFLEALGATVMVTPLLTALPLGAWGVCASFVPGIAGIGDPPLPVLIGIAAWFLVTLVLWAIFADRGDVYGGGWAP